MGLICLFVSVRYPIRTQVSIVYVIYNMKASYLLCAVAVHTANERKALDPLSKMTDMPRRYISMTFDVYLYRLYLTSY